MNALSVLKRAGCGAVLAACLLASGCATQQADRLFAVGDYGSAIEAYEAYLLEAPGLNPRDAPVLMNLALAYAQEGSRWHDPERSEHYLRLLVDGLPASPQAHEAEWLLRSAADRHRLAELEEELEVRDQQLARLNAVLRLVAEAETRLRSEVEDKDEARADLEGRLAALSRRARGLASEVADLESELDALKQIDRESATGETESPPP